MTSVIRLAQKCRPYLIKKAQVPARPSPIKLTTFLLKLRPKMLKDVTKSNVWVAFNVWMYTSIVKRKGILSCQLEWLERPCKMTSSLMSGSDRFLGNRRRHKPSLWQSRCVKMLEQPVDVVKDVSSAKKTCRLSSHSQSGLRHFKSHHRLHRLIRVKMKAQRAQVRTILR